VPETEVNDLTNNIVRNFLQSKPGVASTNPFGSKSRQVTVDIDPAALLARGLTPSDLVDAMAVQNLILPTGTIKVGSTEYDVTLNGAIAAIPRIGDIPVRTANGTTTLIRDVANVATARRRRPPSHARTANAAFLLPFSKGARYRRWTSSITLSRSSRKCWRRCPKASI
jgi:AcrB/AcrD/AcrF family.